MNFDDRFLGLLNMLGGMNGNKSTPQDEVKQNQAMGLDKIMTIMGLMQGLQGFSGGQGAKTQNNGGLDLMKIIPLLSALKGGIPMGNMPVNNTANCSSTPQKNTDVMSASQNIEDTISTASNEKQVGYKDKYSAIPFAGNEVIYTLGKLWKTYKA